LDELGGKVSSGLPSGKPVTTYRGEHMPRVEEEKGYNEVEDICRHEWDNQGKEELITVNVRESELLLRCLDLDGLDRDEDWREDQVEHDANPKVYLRHIEFVRSLRTVAQGENETCE